MTMRRHDYDKLRTELQLAQITLAEVLRQLPAAWDEMTDGLPGYPTSTGGGGSSSTLNAAGHPGGLDRFVTAPNLASEDMRTLRRSAIAATNSARSALEITRRWNLTSPTGEHVARVLSGGDCHACGVFCSGAERDRLRSGLCDSCRQSWRRYQERTASEQGGGDRAEWLLTRRRDILAAEA
jgi:hypothetical protein